MNQYIEVLKKLNSLSLFRKDRIDLSNIIKVTKLVGNPQNQLQFVHVAGTNGKGSVTLKVQQLLGQRSGRFTSPHISSFRERITIDDNPIQQEYMIDNLKLLYRLCEIYSIKLTFFEYLTVLALMYYRDSNIQYVAWETGLGGRLDATNLIQNPLLSIITSIGYDHQKVLGNTLEEIAKEKAGIIKQNQPTLIGPNAKPYQIFIEESQNKNSPLTIIKEQYNTFEQENNAIVKKAGQILKIDNKLIEKAMTVKQPCRMEYVPNHLTTRNIILDVGHNLSAVQRVINEIDPKNTICIYGTSSQKDSQQCLQILKQCQQLYLVQAKHFRAKLISQMEENDTKVIENGEIASTIKYALDQSTKENTILIIGSFYIMREARQFLGYKDLCDPIELSL